ncbi:MAG: DivIVA domain-containing protein [Eubacterium sp.]|nr:DivIVA domain-containing protein [Eubacterium sp.]
MITPSQIRQKKISTVEGGGYDRSEVNELLLEIIESYEAVYAENKELYRKMEILANRIEEYRADEDTIKNALIAAQKTADKLMNDTKQKAAQSLEESAKTAQKTVVDAKEKADKIISSARDYVANLTNEKEKAAGEIVDEAEKKASDAVAGAKVVAQDVLEKAKSLSQDLIGKAKAEKENQKELVEKLNAQSKSFKESLISLYEKQLEAVKNMTENADVSQIKADEDNIEKELNDIYSSIDELTKSDDVDKVIDKAKTVEIEEEKAVDEEIKQEADENTEVDEVIAEDAQEPTQDDDKNETEAVEAESAQGDSKDSEDDAVDEIIEEIESGDKKSIGTLDEVDDTPKQEKEEPVSEEETKAAVDAFSSDEITPIEDTGAIPEINDEPELEEKPQPFENYFHVNREDPHNTDETISLIPEDDDEDEDEEDNKKFKGFFKKKK